MMTRTEFAWNGERNRQLDVYRPCACGVCSRNRKGVGYLSCSDAAGRGFTVWIQSEEIFQRLSRVFKENRGRLNG
jgi:hypothetical protein